MKPPPRPATGATVEDVLPGEAAVAAAARRSLDGHSAGPRAHLALPRPRLRRRRRLHRPRQLRHQHRRRRQVRLPAALGRPRREPDRDGRADPVGEARHRHRQEPRRALPRELLAAHLDRPLAAGRAGGDGDCDIAEVVGAALGLNLLFGIPLFPAGADRRRRRLRDPRPAAEGVPPARGRRSRPWSGSSSPPSPSSSSTPARTAAKSAEHLFVPGFAGTESILLATGIIGATVMPHVIYLHSALTQKRIVGRDDGERQRILGFERVDVVIALSLAGAGQPLDDDRRRRALPRQRPDRRRLDRRRLRRASRRWSPTDAATSSASPCSPPASPPPRSGRWRARS